VHVWYHSGFAKITANHHDFAKATDHRRISSNSIDNNVFLREVSKELPVYMLSTKNHAWIDKGRKIKQHTSTEPIYRDKPFAIAGFIVYFAT